LLTALTEKVHLKKLLIFHCVFLVCGIIFKTAVSKPALCIIIGSILMRISKDEK